MILKLLSHVFSFVFVHKQPKQRHPNLVRILLKNQKLLLREKKFYSIKLLQICLISVISDSIFFEFSMFGLMFLYHLFTWVFVKINNSENVFCIKSNCILKSKTFAINFLNLFNPLSGKLPTNCLSVFEHFVG